jgi:cell division protease FtsH
MEMKANRNWWVYLIVAIALGTILFTLFRPQTESDDLSLRALVDEINAGKIAKIAVSEDTLKVTRVDSSQAISRKETGVSLLTTLDNLGVQPDKLAGVTVAIQAPGIMSNWVSILGTVLSLVVVVVLFYLILRQAQGGNSQAMAFGRSKARVFSGDKPTVTFADVAGAEEAKHELQEVVEFLKAPQKFAALGARIPKGVLLVGPPGTGKTLMAKAVSGEAGVPFFSISGSEFVEMFVGVGASRVRDLFEQAKRHSPCIVFVDEVDAVGRHRGAGLGGSHDEREQTLNQILVEMDGFDTDTNVIVVAATNRPDILDPALLRPGRFDRRVIMDRPDMQGRKAILEVHVRGKPLGPDVNLEVMAKQTPGFVGADIENLVNEAAILAARQNKKMIEMADFQESVERVMAGRERRSRLLTPRDKQVVAYHEAGHALVTHHVPHGDPVHKISVISRGMALGYMMPLPEEDRVMESRSKYQDELAGLLGGRVAEEIIFGDVTTGASNDLERATQLARKMATEYGMSAKLGPMTFGQKEELVFLGRELGEQRNYSEEVAQEIDREVSALVQVAYQKAREILTTYRWQLDRVAQTLIEQETLDATQFTALLAA